MVFGLLRVIVPVFWSVLSVGCHPPPPQHLEVWDELPPVDQGKRIVEDAQALSHVRPFVVDGKAFPYDCSGYIGAVLYQNGIDLFRGASELDIRGNGVRIIHEYLAKYGTLYRTAPPKPGDFIFFDNTYDRNRDGKLNDTLTHIGIVEEVDADGTVHFIHNVRGSIRRYAMNLEVPHLHEDPEGKVINSYLRRKKRTDRGRTPHLTGGLFATFGSLSSITLTQRN